MLSGDFFCLKLAHAGYVPYICNIKHREIEQSVARRAHNPKVAGSSPALATKIKQPLVFQVVVFIFYRICRTSNRMFHHLMYHALFLNHFLV